MIQQESILEVADNSGARHVLCIRVLGGSKRKYAYVGDVIVAVVKDTVRSSSGNMMGKSGGIKKGEIVRCVVVRSKKARKYKEGHDVSFGDNAVVIVNKDGNPRGSRVFGPVSKVLRDSSGYSKILSLACEVL